MRRTIWALIALGWALVAVAYGADYLGTNYPCLNKLHIACEGP